MCPSTYPRLCLLIFQMPQERRPASRGLTKRFTQRFQKPRRRPPPPPPPPTTDEDPDAEDYQNVQDDIYVNKEAFRFAISVDFSVPHWHTHSEHRFPAPSSKEGCRKPVLGVWLTQSDLFNTKSQSRNVNIGVGHVLKRVWNRVSADRSTFRSESTCSNVRPAYIFNETPLLNNPFFLVLHVCI